MRTLALLALALAGSCTSARAEDVPLSVVRIAVAPEARLRIDRLMTDGNRLVMAGELGEASATGGVAFIAAQDPDGGNRWVRVLSGRRRGLIHDLEARLGGGYLVAGSTSADVVDIAFVAGIDASGSVDFVAPLGDSHEIDIEQLADGSILVNLDADTNPARIVQLEPDGRAIRRTRTTGAVMRQRSGSQVFGTRRNSATYSTEVVSIGTDLAETVVMSWPGEIRFRATVALGDGLLLVSGVRDSAMCRYVFYATGAASAHATTHTRKLDVGSAQTYCDDVVIASSADGSRAMALYGLDLAERRVLVFDSQGDVTSDAALDLATTAGLTRAVELAVADDGTAIAATVGDNDDATAIAFDAEGNAVWRSVFGSSESATPLASAAAIGRDGTRYVVAGKSGDVGIMAASRFDASGSAAELPLPMTARSTRAGTMLDGAGGVIVATTRPDHRYTVASVDPATAIEQWRFVDAAPLAGTKEPRIQLARSGDAIVASAIALPSVGYPLSSKLTALERSTGAVRWSQQRSRTPEVGAVYDTIATTSLIAADDGALYHLEVRYSAPGGATVPLLRRLDPATGAAMFDVALPPIANAQAFPLLAANAAGVLRRVSNDEFRLHRAADGSEAWAHVVAGGVGFPMAVSLPDDDFAVAYSHARSATPASGYIVSVDRVDAGTGALVWRTRIDRPEITGALAPLVARAGDDVLVATREAYGGSSVIARVDGSSGAIEWLARLPKVGLQHPEVRHVALGKNGDVVALATRTFPQVAYEAVTDRAVMRFAADDGAFIGAHALGHEVDHASSAEPRAGAVASTDLRGDPVFVEQRREPYAEDVLTVQRLRSPQSAPAGFKLSAYGGEGETTSDGVVATTLRVRVSNTGPTAIDDLELEGWSPMAVVFGQIHCEFAGNGDCGATSAGLTLRATLDLDPGATATLTVPTTRPLGEPAPTMAVVARPSFDLELSDWASVSAPVRFAPAMFANGFE